MSDNPTLPNLPPGDKPWWQRSSFSSAVLVSVTLVEAGLRHGWGSIPDESYQGAVLAWLACLAFTTLSPSGKA